MIKILAAIGIVGNSVGVGYVRRYNVTWLQIFKVIYLIWNNMFYNISCCNSKEWGGAWKLAGYPSTFMWRLVPPGKILVER